MPKFEHLDPVNPVRAITKMHEVKIQRLHLSDPLRLYLHLARQT